MSDLTTTIRIGLAHMFEDYRNRVLAMAGKLSDEQFWTKPFEYGNSFGNLVLHIDGNLSYYIGTQIHHTGYIRNRELEFAPVHARGQSEALASLEATVSMVVASLADQSDEDWSQAYSAVGVDDIQNRFEMYLRCAAHFHHHIGQMTYIVKEWTSRNS